MFIGAVGIALVETGEPFNVRGCSLLRALKEAGCLLLGTSDHMLCCLLGLAYIGMQGDIGELTAVGVGLS